jgi:hypothetical protein
MTAREAVAGIANLPVAALDGGLSRLKGFVGDVNSTNLTIVSGLCVGIATEVAYLTAMLLGKHPEPVTFGMWLGFVASWIGFGVRQFRIKRDSHDEHGTAARARRASGTQETAP